MDEESKIWGVYRGQYRFGMLGAGHAEIVERHLKSDRKRKVLHVGSSSNPVVNRNIASLVDEIICGDLPIPAINLARRAIPKVTTLGMDLFQMPFRNGTFDLVLAIGIPPIYKHPVEALMEFYRVNTSKGKLIVCNRDGGGDVCIDQYKGMAESIGYRVLEEKIGWDQEEDTNRYLLVLKK